MCSTFFAALPVVIDCRSVVSWWVNLSFINNSVVESAVSVSSSLCCLVTLWCGGAVTGRKDSEEISNVELADALEQMWQKQRYHDLFFMVDTCQSQSMFQLFYSPNILAVGSSHVGEDSLSHHVDPAIGVYIIDRYTYYALEFLESVQPDSQHTMAQFLKVSFPLLLLSSCCCSSLQATDGLVQK